MNVAIRHIQATIETNWTINDTYRNLARGRFLLNQAIQYRGG
jgi:hypothetical protein